MSREDYIMNRASVQTSSGTTETHTPTYRRRAAASSGEGASEKSDTAAQRDSTGNGRYIDTGEPKRPSSSRRASGSGEHHHSSGEHHHSSGEHHHSSGEHHHSSGEHHHSSGEHHHSSGEHRHSSGEHHHSSGEHHHRSGASGSGTGSDNRSKNVKKYKRKKDNGIKFLIIVSIVLLIIGGAYLLINDINADRCGKEKSAKTVTFTVDEGDTFDTIADKLSDCGIVRYRSIFGIIAGRYDYSSGFRTGEIEMSTNTSYAQIYSVLISPKAARETVTIQFPDGSEVTDIVKLFLKNGIGTQAGFDKALAEADFGYDYIPAAGTENRMEGFLFPDTYEFYKDTSEKDALQKLVDTFDKKVYTDGVKTLVELSGMSFYENLTLASIIQRETGGEGDMKTISSVFHNRLDAGKKLQSDACYSYKIPKAQRQYSLTAEQIITEDPYNTYYVYGLTPTPICNPTVEAVMAALDPANTDYMYFCYVGNGVTKFAKTYEEHKENIKEYKEWLRQNG